jgi:hypothetical protein
MKFQAFIDPQGEFRVISGEAPVFCDPGWKALGEVEADSPGQAMRKAIQTWGFKPEEQNNV